MKLAMGWLVEVCTSAGYNEDSEPFFQVPRRRSFNVPWVCPANADGKQIQILALATFEASTTAALSTVDFAEMQFFLLQKVTTIDVRNLDLKITRKGCATSYFAMIQEEIAVWFL